MSAKWKKICVWFVFVCMLSLTACVHNSCEYTAESTFQAFFCWPAASFILLGDELDSMTEEMREIRRVNLYANKNKDDIIDYDEAKSLLLMVGYTEEKIKEGLPYAEMYAITECKKIQPDMKKPVTKKRKNKVLISLFSWHISEVVKKKKAADTEALSQRADKDMNGKIDVDEIKQTLLELGYPKTKIEEQFKEVKQKFFEFKFEVFVNTFSIDQKWEDDKRTETAYVTIPWHHAEKLLSRKK